MSRFAWLFIRNPLSARFVVGPVFLVVCISHLNADENAVPAEITDESREMREYSVLGFDGDRLPAVREHLERILDRKMQHAEFLWQLDREQIEKQTFVGNKEISRLIEMINAHRRELHSSEQNGDRMVDTPFNRQSDLIRFRLRSGPFEEDSLFSKALMNRLTPLQREAARGRREKAAIAPSRILPQNVAELIRTYRVKERAYRISCRHDGKQAAFIDWGESIRIYSVPEMKLLDDLKDVDKPLDFNFSPTNEWAAIARLRKVPLLLNLATGKRVRLDKYELPVDADPDVDEPPMEIEFSPDGSLVVAAGYGSTATLWSVATGKGIRAFPLGGKGGLTPVFSPDGKLLAIGNSNAPTELFEVSTGRRLRVAPYRTARELKFHPSGDILGIIDWNGDLHLWNINTGDTKDLTYYGNEAYALDWSSDGKLLAASGVNMPVTLWNTETLTVVNELECQEGVGDVEFSPDGTRLLYTGSPWVKSDGGTIEVWAVP